MKHEAQNKGVAGSSCLIDGLQLTIDDWWSVIGDCW